MQPMTSIGSTMALIFSIPHKFHSYPTCGNWQYTKGGVLVIFVSREIPEDSQDLVAIHELCEAKMCIANGVTQKQVDDFDMNFEANRKDGDESEPGDHVEAPYYKQHRIATAIETILAAQMGVGWQEHEALIGKLFE